jgi:lipid-A-disaccharide synthase
MPPKSIAIVAGEASGDLHASHVIRALRARHPDISIWAVGGHAMREAGAHIIVDANELAVVGITEVFGKVPRLLKAVSQIKRLLQNRRPDLIILIDFPDFNLYLAGAAKKLGIPVLYYISPQIWAWRSSRVKKIKKRVDHMAVILPFEAAFYTQNQVPVTFVGHPLMDTFSAALTDTSPPPNDALPVIGLLPGSRHSEVSRLLPVMLQAARRLNSQNPSMRFLVSSAASLPKSLVESIAAAYRVPNLEIVRQSLDHLFPKCLLVVTASGTASLQAAIWGVPMIVTYIVSPLSYALGRLLIHVPHIGLANLIAQKRIVPELVQNQMTAEAVAAEVTRLLKDTNTRETMRRELSVVRQRLGQPGACERVADIACSLMGCNHAI